MKQFAEKFNDFEIVQQAAAQITWRSIMILIDKNWTEIIASIHYIK